MIDRRRARELALQILFLWDANRQSDAGLAASTGEELCEDMPTRQRGLEMAGGAWEMRESADQTCLRLAPQWPPHRQPAVDRSILRLAIWELTNAAAPPKVILDEAIELAKLFSTENSPSFVNGVLDAVLKELQPAAEPSTATESSPAAPDHPQPTGPAASA